MRSAIFGILLGIGMLLPIGQLRGALITVGTHDLLPNTAGQVIQIPVTGGETVAAFDMYLQIVHAGGAFPTFQSVDILNGTIYDGVPVTFFGSADLPDLQYASIDPNVGTVTADGIAVFATIDTTGLFSGSWPLKMTDISFGGIDGLGTLYSDVNGTQFATVINGEIRIAAAPGGEVPEPSALAIWGLLGIGCCLGARRFRR